MSLFHDFGLVVTLTERQRSEVRRMLERKHEIDQATLSQVVRSIETASAMEAADRERGVNMRDLRELGASLAHVSEILAKAPDLGMNLDYHYKVENGGDSVLESYQADLKSRKSHLLAGSKSEVISYFRLSGTVAVISGLERAVAAMCHATQATSRPPRPGRRRATIHRQFIATLADVVETYTPHITPSATEGSPFYELAAFLLTDYLGLKIKDPRRHIVRALASRQRRGTKPTENT